jgi:polysaccharide export outer membrane protein
MLKTSAYLMNKKESSKILFLNYNAYQSGSTTVLNRLLFSLSTLFFLLIVSGCNLDKKFVYLNDGEQGKAIRSTTSRIIISPGDRLEIRIAGLEPQSALPFYFSAGQGSQVNSVENPPNTYFVNSDGMVAIPVLGAQKLGGLHPEEAESLLKEKLKDIIKSPVITIRLYNFMISVLGEVKSPGYYRIVNNRVNLLEALAMAGDINSNANRGEIIVWRNEGGEMKSTLVNLTSTSLFQSPVFDLKQNDIVYVRPNKSGLLQPTLFRSAIPTGIGIASLIVTALVLFFR